MTLISRNSCCEICRNLCCFPGVFRGKWEVFLLSIRPSVKNQQAQGFGICVEAFRYINCHLCACLDLCHRCDGARSLRFITAFLVEAFRAGYNRCRLVLPCPLLGKELD